MATATAMVPPPPPRGPPPKPSSASRRIPNRPPPPPGPPPPPPRPPVGGPPRKQAPASVSGLKRPALASSSSTVATGRPTQRQKRTSVCIRAPVVLRDVTVFQKKHQVGQGTYGSVFMGADKDTGEVVALKRINTEQEENGFPITAIREVKILKALNHENIVNLKEIVTSKDQTEIPKNVFMVFEYLEFDLTGILETPSIKLTQDHIKSWSQQLLRGVHYMHTNKIIHRDLKASNLLVNKRGELKIADWGLARSWNSEMKRLTNRVITLWYRPPELLLGCIEYTPKIDLWSVGCIIAEMFRRTGLLKGSNEASQLDLIFRTLGHPKLEDWSNIHSMCPLWKNYEPKAGEKPFPRKIRDELRNRLPPVASSWMTEHAKDLIDNLLTHNPQKRWSAAEALTAEWFFDHPIVKPAEKLNMKFGVDSVHEWEARRKHEQMMAQRKKEVAAGSNKRVEARPYATNKAIPSSGKVNGGSVRPPPPAGPPRSKPPPPRGAPPPPRPPSGPPPR